MKFSEIERAHDEKCTYPNSFTFDDGVIAHEHREALIALVKRMKPYMKHTDECDIKDVYKQKCTCGLDKLMRDLE